MRKARLGSVVVAGLRGLLAIKRKEAAAAAPPNRSPRGGGWAQAADGKADGRCRQGRDGSRRPSRLGDRPLRSAGGSSAFWRRVPRLEERSGSEVRARRQ